MNERRASVKSAERLAKFILEARQSMCFDTETSVAAIMLLSGFACEIAKGLEAVGEKHGSNTPEAVAMRTEVRKIAAGLFDASSRCKGIVDDMNALIASDVETPGDSARPPSEPVH